MQGCLRDTCQSSQTEWIFPSDIPHFKVKLEVNLFQQRMSRYLRKAEGQKVIGSDTKNAALETMERAVDHLRTHSTR